MVLLAVVYGAQVWQLRRQRGHLVQRIARFFHLAHVVFDVWLAQRCLRRSLLIVVLTLASAYCDILTLLADHLNIHVSMLQRVHLRERRCGQLHLQLVLLRRVGIRHGILAVDVVHVHLVQHGLLV